MVRRIRCRSKKPNCFRSKSTTQPTRRPNSKPTHLRFSQPKTERPKTPPPASLPRRQPHAGERGDATSLSFSLSPSAIAPCYPSLTPRATTASALHLRGALPLPLELELAYPDAPAPGRSRERALPAPGRPRPRPPLRAAEAEASCHSCARSSSSSG